MDLLQASPGKLFRNYLTASLGSAVVMSIYSFVDAIAVGQYEGPTGAAAMAIISPVFGIFIFLALMGGIGGSVLMSAAWGEGDKEEGYRWFSAALLLMGAATLIIWAIFLIFHNQILRLFGADEALLPLAMRYGRWLIGFAPLLIASVFLACFVRNDGNPNLAMAAVLIGGGANIFGDWFLVFPMNMGISGAGLATIASNAIQVVILCTHFFSKKNTLRLRRPVGLTGRIKAICSVGFGAGMLDLANVVLFCLFNNQIMRYGGVNELAVFGAVETMSSLFQSLFSGIGQALQPIVSVNYGAKKQDRVKKILRYALITGVIMGILFALIPVCFPTFVVRLLMDATPDVLALAGSIVRPYGLTFLFLGVNVVATYQLQSTLRARKATVLSLCRGLIFSGILIFLLPAIFGLNGIWYAMPLSEALVCILSCIWLRGKSDHQAIA